MLRYRGPQRSTGIAARVVAVAVWTGVVTMAAASCGQAGIGGSQRAATIASGPSSSASLTSSPAAESPCGTPFPPNSQAVKPRTADGVTLAGVEMGTGERGVVLVNELGRRNLCGWWDYGGYLACRGFRVLLFNHRCTAGSDCAATDDGGGLVRDIEAAIKRLHDDGALRVALLGASQGASESLLLGARPPEALTAVIALSADELTTALAVAPYPANATAAAARVRIPALVVVAQNDPHVSVSETRALFDAIPDPTKRLIVLPGSAAHGWDLLAPNPDGSRPALSETLVAFLAEHLS